MQIFTYRNMPNFFGDDGMIRSRVCSRRCPRGSIGHDRLSLSYTPGVPNKGALLKCLSSMKRNFYVRFLGGNGAKRSQTYPAHLPEGTQGGADAERDWTIKRESKVIYAIFRLARLAC